MSFSSRVKEELARHIGEARHCKIAEIAAIINMCGKVKLGDDGDVSSFKIQTENPAVARKCFTLLKKTFNIKVEVSIRRNTQLKKHRVYHIYVMDKADAITILKVTKLYINGEVVRHISPLIVQTTCCKRAYIRGAFLASGSISDPEKTYHLEFVNHDERHAKELMALVNDFELDSKVVVRKKYFVLYLKEGTHIVDLLNVMEAHVALMELENLRIIKEMRNNVNRIVNCEAANINKTVSAAVKQLYDIEYIDRMVGLSTLPENLESIAYIRIENPDSSLVEMGQLLDPVVGKSGVNHRLRKISQLAEKLKSSREDFHDREKNNG
jgi:DNA-binding protein WhiA